MNIAFLTREFPPDTVWGGQARTYHDLAHSLTADGHEVHVICQAKGPARSYSEQGVFVHTVGGYTKQWSAISRIDYSIRALLRLRRIITKYSIDVVDGVSDGTDVLLYSLYRKLPLVVQVHGSIRGVLANTKFSRIQKKQVRMVMRSSDFVLKRADRIIAIAPVAYGEIVEKSKISPDKIRLIYLPIDINKYHYVESDIKTRINLTDGASMVLFVGRLEPRKGVHTLCEAMPIIRQSIPNTNFVFIGKDVGGAPDGGLYRSFIEKVATEHGIESFVHFYEHVSHDDLLQFYSTSDVVVCPSLHEIASSVPMEAMACGKPVISTPTGISEELSLEGSNGGIVPTENSSALAAETIRILKDLQKDPHLRVNIAKHNRSVIEERCSSSRMSSQVAQLYEEAIEEVSTKKINRC